MGRGSPWSYVWPTLWFVICAASKLVGGAFLGAFVLMGHVVLTAIFGGNHWTPGEAWASWVSIAFTYAVYSKWPERPTFASTPSRADVRRIG